MTQSWLDEPGRRTAVLGEYEVVVVGGGPAGVMAAAAAARAGRSTILVERNGYTGGAGSAGGLSTFCGLHANVHGEHRQVIHGLADELLGRMAALDGLNEPHLSFANRILAQAYDISAYKIALDDMLFVGDRLDPEGNDYPVKALGVPCHAVEGWEDTDAFLTELIPTLR